MGVPSVLTAITVCMQGEPVEMELEEAEMFEDDEQPARKRKQQAKAPKKRKSVEEEQEEQEELEPEELEELAGLQVEPLSLHTCLLRQASSPPRHRGLKPHGAGWVAGIG